MEESELRQARTTIASARDALRAVEKTLQQAGDDMSGQPCASRITEAISAIQAVCSDLGNVGPELKSPLDHSIEQEGLARAISEVESGEYDMQG